MTCVLFRRISFVLDSLKRVDAEVQEMPPFKWFKASTSSRSAGPDHARRFGPTARFSNELASVHDRALGRKAPRFCCYHSSSKMSCVEGGVYFAFVASFASDRSWRRERNTFAASCEINAEYCNVYFESNVERIGTPSLFTSEVRSRF